MSQVIDSQVPLIFFKSNHELKQNSGDPAEAMGEGVLFAAQIPIILSGTLGTILIMAAKLL